MAVNSGLCVEILAARSGICGTLKVDRICGRKGHEILQTKLEFVSINELLYE
jgi:hypothetical protein